MNRYRYVRDVNHNPLAVIACIGPGMVGAAVCSKNDQFSKRRGKQIAEGRAIIGKEVGFKDRQFVNYKGEMASLANVVSVMVEEMKQRSMRFAEPPTQFNPSKDV
jgi:hypothetical protein